jgi:hypothetical protein
MLKNLELMTVRPHQTETWASGPKRKSQLWVECGLRVFGEIP